MNPQGRLFVSNPDCKDCNGSGLVTYVSKTRGHYQQCCHCVKPADNADMNMPLVADQLAARIERIGFALDIVNEAIRKVKEASLGQAQGDNASSSTGGETSQSMGVPLSSDSPAQD